MSDVLRSMPVNADAERAVLACCLRDPMGIIPKVSAALGGELAAKAFYIPAHYLLWIAIETLHRKQTNFDLISLNTILNDSGEMEQVGGPGAVAELLDDVPSVGFVDHYLELLVEKLRLREIIQAAAAMANGAYEYDGERPVVDLINEAEASLFKLRGLGVDHAQSQGPREVARVLPEVVAEFEAAYKSRGGVTRGLATGFTELDRMTLGLEGGKVYVIAARPAMGKTALAMNMVEHIAGAGRVPSLVVSLEMSAGELVKRLVVSNANVDIYRARDGFFSREDLGRVFTEAEKLKRTPIYIDDPAELRIHELRARVRRAKVQHGIGLVVIDYLQLLKGSSKQASSNRVLEIGEISRGIKAMAKELEIPAIVLSQLNRKAEDRKNGVPMLADLRESGDIEQDADLVGLLYRPGYYERSAEAKASIGHLAFLNIAKQRSGPTGGGEKFKKEHPEWEYENCPGIPFNFEASKVRFENPEGVQMYG